MLRSGLAGILCLWSMSVVAEALTISEAWVAAAPPGQTVMAGYAVLINQSDSPVKLLQAQSAQFERVEWHQSVIEQGMARMRPLSDVRIEAHQQTTLEPGGMHLMLINPHTAIKPGDQIQIQFRSDASEVFEALFEVRHPNHHSTDASHEHHQHLNH